MRDRLIELLKEAHEGWLRYVDDCAFNQIALSFTFEQMFADHLIANDVIVPPCRVGDVVYFIYETYDEEGINRCILDCKVEQLGIDSKSTWFQLKLPLGVKLSGYFGNNTLGKSVFLTREEAERALKGE